MFSRKKTLVFEFDQPTRVRLHMWFVFFPIDVILLNADKQVVEIKQNFKPFTVFTSQEKATYCIEAPAGFVQKQRVFLQDKLRCC